MEGAGTEYLGSILRWAYFRKKTDEGEFNIFSDNGSRVKHLNRILPLLGIVGLAEIVIALSNISAYLNMGTVINLSAGILCLLLALLIGYGYLRINSKKRKPKKELQLFE